MPTAGTPWRPPGTATRTSCGPSRSRRAAAVLLDGGAPSAAGGAGRAARRALPRPAGPGVLLQLGRGGQRERAAPGAEAHRPPEDRLAARRVARPHRRHARRDRRRHGTRRRARRPGCRSRRKVPFDDVAALDAAVDDRVAAVIIEPVQGLAGARDCSPEFLAAARRICDERGAVLIFDEVQCGVGRCGAFSAAEAFGVAPDVLTFAKGLARGLPDRRRRRDAGGHRRARTRRPGQHLRRRAGALRRGAGEHRGDRARGARSRTRSRWASTSGAARARSACAGSAAAGCCSASTSTGRPSRCSGRSSAGGYSPAPPPIPQVLRLLPPLSFSPAEADLLLAGLEEVLAVTKRDFLALEDWSPDEIEALLALAARVKRGEVTRRAGAEGAGDGVHGPEPAHPHQLRDRDVPARRARASCSSRGREAGRSRPSPAR